MIKTDFVHTFSIGGRTIKIDFDAKKMIGEINESFNDANLSYPTIMGALRKKEYYSFEIEECNVLIPASITRVKTPDFLKELLKLKKQA